MTFSTDLGKFWLTGLLVKHLYENNKAYKQFGDSAWKKII